MSKNDNVILKGSYIEKVDTPDGKATIVKQFKDEHIEINIYQLKAGKSFYLKPPQSDSGIKTYQIMSGKFQSIHSKKIYDVGDIFVLRHSDELLYIQVQEEVSLLVHSFNEDAFDTTNQSFRAVHDVLMKIQQKDNYTNEHNKRVYQLAREIGLLMGYDSNRLHDLIYAARYHDVGKIYIPDEILNKPSALTADEFEIMKTHVIKGKDMIKGYFNDRIFQIMSQHHERIDGSGYPNGLKGDEIEEEAKLLAVLDSFDAMTSDRIYKKGKSISEAIEELYHLSGTHYDARYIDFLVQLLERDPE